LTNQAYSANCLESKALNFSTNLMQLPSNSDNRSRMTDYPHSTLIPSQASLHLSQSFVPVSHFLFLIICSSACDWLERVVPGMTCYVSSGM